MKNKLKGNMIIVIGILFLLLGIFFFFYNIFEDYKAGENSKKVLVDIKEYIEENKDNEDIVIEDERSIKYINGYSYMGYITISKIGIELPIMTEWSYKKLKISPCIHFGSIESNDLVIAAHAYRSHFKNISKLTKGDIVEITDLNGNKYKYKVIKKEVLEKVQVDEVKNSGYDLVLYTCDKEGSKRITIFCNKV